MRRFVGMAQKSALFGDVKEGRIWKKALHIRLRYVIMIQNGVPIQRPRGDPYESIGIGR